VSNLSVWQIMAWSCCAGPIVLLLVVGLANAIFNGLTQIDSDGYVLIYTPNHPHANNAGCVREHRLAMEKKLGRYLKPSEVVHHKDGDRKNNRIGNLEVFGSNGQHLAATLKGKCPKWTADGKRRLREAAAKRRAACGKA